MTLRLPKRQGPRRGRRRPVTGDARAVRGALLRVAEDRGGAFRHLGCREAARSSSSRSRARPARRVPHQPRARAHPSAELRLLPREEATRWKRYERCPRAFEKVPRPRGSPCARAVFFEASRGHACRRTSLTRPPALLSGVGSQAGALSRKPTTCLMRPASSTMTSKPMAMASSIRWRLRAR